MPTTPNRTYFNPSNASISESFDIEFDDAVLETRFWKSRAEGTQLQGSFINRFTQGDITFGKNPIIENKIAALYVGSTIIGGESGNEAEDPSRVALNGHS